MTTTAKMREKARLYESRCDWGNAGLCWRAALKLYPDVSGQLAEHDKAAILRRAESCESAYRQIK